MMVGEKIGFSHEVFRFWKAFWVFHVLMYELTKTGHKYYDLEIHEKFSYTLATPFRPIAFADYNNIAYSYKVINTTN